MEKGASEEKKLSGVVREFAAGGVVFRHKNGKTYWLVTKSSPSKDYPQTYWRLPKGWLDDEDKGLKPGPLTTGLKKATEEDLQKAALREVAEEGGVKAKIVNKVGSERLFFTVSDQKILKFVTFYLMAWLTNLSEGPGFETSEVAWLIFEDARKKLKYESEKKVLDKANTILNSGLQESLV